ncbi:MAG: PDZ domain-containing protein [Acidobacteria bacterium]|jgi:S1-C subfamily serine protease|nr:PDZ domain-containing protein [Acidobacteriota bacterium]
MKNILIGVFLILVAGALPAVAVSDGVQEDRTDSRNPHRELREAVAEIRSQYATGDRSFTAPRIAGMSSNMRLGIILGGSWHQAREEAAGAAIMAVTPGSPAEEAGLMAGDVVISFNGEPLFEQGLELPVASMKASQRLVELARDLENGDAVVLEYIRDGSTHQADLVAREIDFGPMLGKLPDHEDLAGLYRGQLAFAHPGDGKWFLPRTWLDMELVALNPGLGEYFGVDSGVLVVRGPDDGDTLALESGDVILGIGGRQVRSPEHAMRILRSYEPDEELTVEIIRHGRSETLTGTVPSVPIQFDFEFRDAGIPADH